MKPKLKDFEAACIKAKGNMTKVAEMFGVSRVSVFYWCKQNPKFMQCIEDQRGRALDVYLNTADLVARGIPKLDKDKKLIGWKVPPDSNMLRYLIGKLGINEGFGEKMDITSNGESIKPEPVTIRFVADREALEKIQNEVPDLEE